MKFYVKEKLGLTQSVTPEGFLLCEAVPINRIGEMIYGPGETPVEVGPDGICRIMRDVEEVFRPETIASFEGKPVVDEHPDSDVTPQNWNDLAVGVVLHARRGVGAQDDTLLADLLITNHEAIEAVKAGKREVSCGYDADYEQSAPGKGRQKNIIGNHVALVDSGRCGPRCAIGDSAAIHSMKGKRRMTIIDRIKEAFKRKDESALDAVLGEISEETKTGDGKTVVHVHVADSKAPARDAEKEEEEADKDKKKTQDAMKDAVFADSRFTDLSKDVKAIKDAVMDKKDDDEDEDEDEDDNTKDANEKLNALELEAPPGTGDKARKARDSAYLEDSFQETIALAEIIAPGSRVPTFDKAATPGKTYDALCQFRRKVLDNAYQFHEESRNFMDELLAGREMKDMKCEKVRDVFRAVGSWRKRFNNQQQQATNDVNNGTRRETAIRTPADLNKRYAELFK